MRIRTDTTTLKVQQSLVIESLETRHWSTRPTRNPRRPAGIPNFPEGLWTVAVAKTVVRGLTAIDIKLVDTHW